MRGVSFVDPEFPQEEEPIRRLYKGHSLEEVMEQKLQVLSVDPDQNSRARLKNAFGSTRSPAVVSPASTLEGAMTQLKEGESFDLLVLSSSFGFEKISSFVSTMKNTDSGKDLITIVVLKGTERDSSFVVKNFLFGVQGFLCEPFSVDGLSELIKVVEEAKVEKEDKKKKAALDFIIEEVIRSLDKCARQLALGQSLGYSLKDFRRGAETLVEIQKGAEESYFQLVISKFTSVPVPKDVPGRKKRDIEKVANVNESAADQKKAQGSQRMRIIRKR